MRTNTNLPENLDTCARTAAGRGDSGIRRGARTLAASVLLLAAAACSSMTGGNAGSRVMVVDGSGTPVRGAILVPDDEYPATSRLRNYTDQELAEHGSDAQGLIVAHLEDCLWDSDGCYHFRIIKKGYEDVTMTVSKALFPPVMRVELKSRTGAPSR